MKKIIPLRKKASADILEIVIVIALVIIGLFVSSLFVASLKHAQKTMIHLKSESQEAQEQLLLFLNVPVTLEEKSLLAIDVALYAFYYWKQHGDTTYFTQLPYSLLNQRVTKERSYMIQFFRVNPQNQKDKTLIYAHQGDHFDLSLIKEQARLHIPLGNDDFVIVYYESYFSHNEE